MARGASEEKGAGSGGGGIKEVCLGSMKSVTERSFYAAFDVPLFNGFTFIVLLLSLSEGKSHFDAPILESAVERNYRNTLRI
jgi:hypothetical protein